MTVIPDHSAELKKAGANVSTRWQALWFMARRYPLGAVGAAIILVFIVTALLANWITPYDPTATNARASLAVPGSAYWLGADFMGRDILSRIIGGAQSEADERQGVGADDLGGGKVALTVRPVLDRDVAEQG